MTVDLSIFEEYHSDCFEYFKNEEYIIRKFVKHPRPFKYQDFNARSKTLINFFVALINEKYDKSYLSKRAFDIEDWGTPYLIRIGLWDESPQQKSYYLIFTETGYVLDYESYNQVNYPSYEEQLNWWNERVIGPNASESIRSAFEDIMFDSQLLVVNSSLGCETTSERIILEKSPKFSSEN